jgi:predicted  nucleic acid-binding Zn-ribbon protein
LAAAERAKADADAALNDRQSELVSARWRHEEARKALDKAQRELSDAQDAHEKAKQDGRDANDLVKQARAQLKRVRT